MTSHLNLHWHRSINYGDMLSPYLLAKVKGVKAKDIIYVEPDADCDKYIITGSILSLPIKNAVIFGAGFANYTDEYIAQNTTIKAVRGFFTLNKIKQPPDDIVIGDPGFMLPLFYNPLPEKKYTVGIVPHIADISGIQCNASGTVIIDLRQQDYETIEQTVERVIFQICQCKAIISGSLHGMVTAQAYGVQVLGRMASDNIVGDGFKFDDLASSGEPDPVKMLEVFKTI